MGNVAPNQHLYAVSIGTAMVKIGRSVRPEKRAVRIAANFERWWGWPRDQTRLFAERKCYGLEAVGFESAWIARLAKEYENNGGRETFICTASRAIEILDAEIIPGEALRQAAEIMGRPVSRNSLNNRLGPRGEPRNVTPTKEE